MSEGEDVKVERGGDTGNTKQKNKGEKAEKGDQRRENPTHSGPTRRGNQDSHKNYELRRGYGSAANRSAC